MIILIPLGGSGERFKKNGYGLPKALINIFGKPILYYLIDNLKLGKIDFIYIAYNKEYTPYRFENKIQNDFPKIKFKFLELKEQTKGAAETINIALKKISTLNDCPILCLDSDNFYTCDIIKLWGGDNKVITIVDEESAPIYSYIKLEGKNVVDIVEKDKISDYACTGAYGFESFKELLEYTQYVLDNQIMQKNEYYTSTVIREMIKLGKNFKNEVIDLKDWNCLGTPLQVRQFSNNWPKISSLDNSNKIKKLRICFDLDNTLVSYPIINGDYSTVQPIQKNIDYLKYLKSFGNTIIIYTARRMKTHGGNTGKLLADIGKITFDTLEKFDIPYDEIHFGKPYADFYIDDLAVSCFDDMEKIMGFYVDNIKPRDFNYFSSDIIVTYTKKSDDLSGEIYFYNNIPREIKDLFPILIDYDEGSKWYKMEKINGLNATSLYLSELMTTENLRHIMNSLRRIQSIDVLDKNIPIYDNYCKKMINRREGYDYSCFEGFEEVFEEIYRKLEEYERNGLGKISCIHGDPVLTNILINNHGKIKFIDMRGKIGDKLTIYGDWLYDWAKLFQSLIGYDSILQDKKIGEEYQKNMIGYFERYFLEFYGKNDFDNLKWITKSLLITLIPLHNNEKCNYYYNLIKLCS